MSESRKQSIGFTVALGMLGLSLLLSAATVLADVDAGTNPFRSENWLFFALVVVSVLLVVVQYERRRE